LETRKKDIIEAYTELNKWIEKESENSSPEKVKNLIIDKLLKVIEQGDKWIWDYPYSFRFQTYLEDVPEEFERFLPNFIAIEYGERPVIISEEETEPEVKKEEKIEEEEEYFNDEDMVTNLISVIDSVDNYNPFIFLFNYDKADSDSARSKFGYSKILSHNNKISFEQIISMAELFDKKLQFDNQVSPEKAHFIKKSKSLSYVQVKHPIKIINISECEVSFECEKELSEGTYYNFTEPAIFSASVVPHRKASPYKGQK
jgi:hypothetical protein